MQRRVKRTVTYEMGAAASTTDALLHVEDDEPTERVRNVRFRPSSTIVAFSLAGLIAGPFLLMAGLSQTPQNLILAGVGLVVTAYGASQFGWVAIIDGELRHRGPFNGEEIHACEVRRVGLSSRYHKGLKFWYPIVDTLDGRSVRIDAIRTPRRKKAERQVEKIRATFDSVPESARSDPFGGHDFARAVVLPPTVEEENTFDGISLTPGYDAYLRQKEAEQTTGGQNPPSSQPTPAPAPAPLPVHEPQPTPQPVAAAAEPAPFVFEPQPMSPVKKTTPVSQPLQPQPVAAQQQLQPRRPQPIAAPQQPQPLQPRQVPAQPQPAPTRQPQPVAAQQQPVASASAPITSFFGSEQTAAPKAPIASLFGSEPTAAEAPITSLFSTPSAQPTPSAPPSAQLAA